MSQQHREEVRKAFFSSESSSFSVLSGGDENNNNNNRNHSLASDRVNDHDFGTSSGARRIAVSSRWLDETVSSSGNSSPVGSPVINHMVVVDELHDVKVEVLEAGLHSRNASSSFDSKIDEQFGKIERKKQKITVVSWSATNDWCSTVYNDDDNDDDDSDEDEDERMDDQRHEKVNRRKRSTLQKLGEMAPDLILLQDLNYEQTIKAMKYLTKAEEHLHDDYDENEDLEPPVYKWFCCGHKHTSEPIKVSKSYHSDDDEEIPTSFVSPLATGGNHSIISTLLKNDVKKKIETDQDPDDLVHEYLPIIYNSETLKCVDCGAFWYSKTPQEPGSKSWDSIVPRFCNWGAFIFKPYDEEDDHIDLLVFNTHWDQGVEARRYASILLRQEVLNRMSLYNSITNRTTFIPTIIGGNLNSLPKSNALSILVQGQDLGAHNSDVNLLADSDDDDDDEEEGNEKIDKKSLIIPCQRQLLPPQAQTSTQKSTKTEQVTDSSSSNEDKDVVKTTEEESDDEESDASSESYSGTWYHNLNLQPTFVDFETNTFETVDYLFVSPCVKTVNLQVLDADLSYGETHKPIVAVLEM
ncbi:hypothetical protein FDP41_008302 [Naegleria fowleri]|uniref:Endonuclease/exonuclease/phosphatase domain-containing protein n=1 Tax=Naegleria fowleri TaxID=5763 RepID=A0A6A5BHS8_NAEFO|nr:uncharacterized protein FDP41_008302 [Naegleria fowleri]KAF0973598.1 hypothetical protein FDP41_008302 [Naegleria fowleri]CAG4718296.1 unnamed protein product [Naegleria fowleri]